MSKRLTCDSCGDEIVRKHSLPSGRVSEGKGTVEIRSSFRRRLVAWLLGPIRVYVWGNKSALVGGEWKRRHLCADCFDRIRDEINTEVRSNE